MRSRTNAVLAVLAIMLSAFIWTGCSRQTEPSDEDIFQAIDASGILKRTDGNLTVISPAAVVQRGPQNEDGSWPVLVKLTLAYKMPDGQNSPPTETTIQFRIFRAKDDAGKSVWKTRLEPSGGGE